MLVLGLQSGSRDARGRVVDEHVERPERLDLLRDARRRDVAAHEHRLGAALAQLVGGGLRGFVVPHVADRDALGALVGEAQRDLATDPA